VKEYGTTDGCGLGAYLMDTNTILIVILLVILLGGGGFYFRRR
jgi:LPXTG-motif cell wall-anchored protein